MLGAASASKEAERASLVRRVALGAVALLALSVLVVPVYLNGPGPVADARIMRDLNECNRVAGPDRPSLLARSARFYWECNGTTSCVELRRQLWGWRASEATWGEVSRIASSGLSHDEEVVRDCDSFLDSMHDNSAMTVTGDGSPGGGS